MWDPVEEREVPSENLWLEHAADAGNERGYELMGGRVDIEAQIEGVAGCNLVLFAEKDSVKVSNSQLVKWWRAAAMP